MAEWADPAAEWRRVELANGAWDQRVRAARRLAGPKAPGESGERAWHAAALAAWKQLVLADGRWVRERTEQKQKQQRARGGEQ